MIIYIAVIDNHNGEAPFMFARSSEEKRRACLLEYVQEHWHEVAGVGDTPDEAPDDVDVAVELFLDIAGDEDGMGGPHTTLDLDEVALDGDYAVGSTECVLETPNVGPNDPKLPPNKGGNA